MVKGGLPGEQAGLRQCEANANKDPGGYHADPGFASGRAAPFVDL